MKVSRLIVAALAVLGLSLMGCPNPTGDDSEDSNDSRGGILTASVSGIVIDAVTQKAIPGVVVSVAGRSATTNSNGVYLITGIPPNAGSTSDVYSASFKITGYEEIQMSVPAVNPAQYKTDDPFAEYEIALAELDVFMAYVNNLGLDPDGSGDPVLPGNWTYSNGTFTSADGTINVNYDQEAQTFQITNSSIGGQSYEYGIGLVVQELAPLTSGLSGTLSVAFTTEEFANDTNDGYTTALIKAGVELWAIEDSGDGTPLPGAPTYGPVITTSTGTFSFTGLPAETNFLLFADSFSQPNAATPPVTYYFAGASESSTSMAPVNVGSFSTVHNVTNDDFETIIYAYDDEAIIISHNIGPVNLNDPLLVDEPITLTFNKAIDPVSFFAYLEVNGSSGYQPDDGDGVWESEDVALTPTWNIATTTVAADTTVSLAAKDTAYETTGHFPYSAVGSPVGDLMIFAGRAADGSGIALQSAGDSIEVFTEENVKLTAIRYLDSAGAAVTRILEDTPELPFDGSIELTFDKVLAATAFQHLYLYDGNGVLLALDPTFAIVNGTASSVVTVDFGDTLPFSSTYSLGYRVASTRPDDVLDNSAAVDGVFFNSSEGLVLDSVNLYRNMSNIYYTEKPDDAINYFGLLDDIVLTFASAIPAGAIAEVELYEAADIAGLENSPDTLDIEQRVQTTTIGTTTLTINPTAVLSLNTKYALAVKLTSSSGVVMFNTKSDLFADFNSVDSSEATSTDIVDMDNTLDDGPDADSTGSYYITFLTETPLAILQMDSTAYPAIATNFTVDTPDGSLLTTITTTDFVATDDIVIEFNKPIATPAADDVELFYWDDANTDTIVNAGEITETPAVVTVSGNTLTINPTGTLAPGLKFVVTLDVESTTSADDFIIRDTLSTDPDKDESIGFQVAADFVQLGTANLTGLVVDATYGADAADTAIPLAWTSFPKDLTSDLFSEAAYYQVWEKLPNGTEFVDNAGANIAELDFGEYFSQDLFGTPTVQGSATVTDYGLIAGGFDSPLLGGRTVQYVVTAYSRTGLLVQSAALSVTDTVDPLLQLTSATAYDTAANFAAATGLALTGTTPNFVFTNGTGLDITFTIHIGNADQEPLAFYTITETFANANVTAVFDVWTNDGATMLHNGFDVLVTIPAGSAVNSSEAVTATIQDYSSNGGVMDRAAGTPDLTIDLTIPTT